MYEFYIIDHSGFIDFLGKFESKEKAQEYIDKEDVESHWLFSQPYLEDFLNFGKEILNKEKK